MQFFGKIPNSIRTFYKKLRPSKSDSATSSGDLETESPDNLLNLSLPEMTSPEITSPIVEPPNKEVLIDCIKIEKVVNDNIVASSVFGQEVIDNVQIERVVVEGTSDRRELDTVLENIDTFQSAIGRLVSLVNDEGDEWTVIIDRVTIETLVIDKLLLDQMGVVTEEMTRESVRVDIVDRTDRESNS